MPIDFAKYYVEGSHEASERMAEAFNQNIESNRTFWYEATRDLRFYVGDQTIWQELYGNVFVRKQFFFNRIQRVINMISGYQRRNRKIITALPVETSDEATANQFSKALSVLNGYMNAYHTISESYEHALKTGFALLCPWVDYRNDPISGDLQLDYATYNSVLLDQFFTKQDLSDAQFVWRKKYISTQEAKLLMPNRADEINALSRGYKDDRFNFLPQIKKPQLNQVSYDEFWYKSTRKATLLVDKTSGETLEWTGEDKPLKEYLAANPSISTETIDKETVKLAISINNRTFYDGPNPYKIDRYPFVPVLANFEPNAPFYNLRIQSVVRNLRDSQYLYNRRRNIELSILESQIASGLKVMEDSLVDDEDAFMSGPGKAIFIKKTAPMGMASVEQIMPPQVPPSMIQLSELLAREINEISGVNEELLGSADDDKAGILSMLRQGAGLTTLQKYFDQLDFSMKLLGEIQISMIQSNFTPGKVKRILNEEPADEFYHKHFSKYDIAVSEGMLTETQRKASFYVLLEMQKLGIPIPVEALMDKAPIPDKGDLLKQIAQQQQQQAQAQQQAQQLQMAQIQAQINNINAQATANQGLGIERASRVEENRALATERRAEAIKDLEQATLDKIRSAKELMGIDLDNLRRLIEIVEQVRGGESTEVAKPPQMPQLTQEVKP